MIDYIKSEQYRLVRKKEIYWVALISLSLLVAALMTLYFSLRADSNFPYATNRFVYLNILTMIPVIIIIGTLINRQLLGKDQKIIKQIVSFGIPRKTIFLTKLVLTLIPFSLLCIFGVAIVMIGGESFLQADVLMRGPFVIAVVNLIPLVLSAFVLGHSLMMVLDNEIYCIPIIFFVFSRWFSDLVQFIETTILGSHKLMNYLPSVQIDLIIKDFLEKNTSILPSSWIVGFIIIFVSLLVGMILFDKKDI